MIRPCGNDNCFISTCIDEITLTFGRGELDEFGFWEIPCTICAKAYKDKYQEASVWPAAGWLEIGRGGERR